MLNFNHQKMSFKEIFIRRKFTEKEIYLTNFNKFKERRFQRNFNFHLPPPTTPSTYLSLNNSQDTEKTTLNKINALFETKKVQKFLPSPNKKKCSSGSYL